MSKNPTPQVTDLYPGLDGLRVKIALSTYCAVLESRREKYCAAMVNTMRRVMSQLPDYLLPEVLDEIGNDWEDQIVNHLQKLRL